MTKTPNTPQFRPKPRLLMGPGPSDVSPRVLAALAQPTLGHLDPEFVSLMDRIQSLLQKALFTENKITLPISAPGSAGMECCFVNLLEPGDKVVIAVNGVFGGRMAEVARRCGAVPVLVEDPWGRAVDPQKVEDTLKKNTHAKVFAFVHSETSTGALSDGETLCRLGHKYDCLNLVDAVTSLGGVPLQVDAWGIDALYSGTQKCLSCPPGLSPVTFSERAMDQVRNRKKPIQSWFLDLNLLTGYWGDGAQSQKRAYHHTAPVNALYALHEALIHLVEEEGVEASWKRHLKNHELLKAGLEHLGLTFVVPQSERLPQLNAVTIPPGVNDAQVRKNLLDKHQIEIGAGLGPLAGKIWRIGLMGETCREHKIEALLKALKTELAH